MKLKSKNIIIKEENRLKNSIIYLNNLVDKMLINHNHHLESLINTLKLVNPLNILSNGYSLVRKNDKVIKSIQELKENDEVNIKLYEGEFISIEKEIK